ncbi:MULTISPECIES: hypothetical protein [Rossellomorea]|uniref:hypothetical protein n=1 Tax=Rossellomorea TaxID=2837508 RepID=UPI001CCA3643|nr:MULTISPECIES: hypothetical protein [Rossellomorea]MCA0149475.1 hypothetical protein [Rossellomorea vietnamensis]WGG46719.1 hypothetical protein P8596_05715 [Rossellomorea sp. DA94]
MKKLAFVFILIHFIIFILWIMNSGYLFSPYGILAWIAIVAIGFMIQIKLEKELMIRRGLAISNGWMVFLMVATVFIYFAVSSMP